MLSIRFVFAEKLHPKHTNGWTLDFSVQISDAKKLKVTSELKHHLTAKVITQAGLADVQIAVSDSSDPGDLSEARTISFEFPETRKETVKVDQRYLHVEFKVRNKISNRALPAHQTFVKFASTNTTNEAVVVAKLVDKRYVFTLDTKEAAEELFNSQGGDYKLFAVVGDTFIHNPVSYQLGVVSLTFPKAPVSKSKTVGSIYKTLPEIEHTFAKELTRPSQTIAYAFTLAVLSPILILLVGFLAVGANIGNFPFSGSKFLNAVGFQVLLTSIILVYTQYWLGVNMFDTINYLFVLAPITIFFGQRALSDLNSTIDVKK